MNYIDLAGILGAFLFFIKVGLHVVIKMSVDEKFDFGAFGQFVNPIFFLPIMVDFRKGSVRAAVKKSEISFMLYQCSC